MSKRIEATKVLDTYWGGKPIPVDPQAIAKAAGITMRPHCEAGTSGRYRLMNGTPTIEFNYTESLTRRRFTIAHELGHHFLGHGERPRDTSAAFFEPYDSKEVAANRFAAELLMPEHAMRVMVMERKIDSVPQLAAAFNVSEPAMLYRLKNLGYIS